MTLISQKGLSLLVLSSIFLSACSSLRTSVHDDVQHDADLATKMQYENRSTSPYSQASISDELWLGPFKWGNENSLKPAELMTEISYSELEPMPIKEVLSKLSRDSGAQITLTKSAKVFLGMETDEESGEEGGQGEVPIQNTTTDGVIMAQPNRFAQSFPQPAFPVDLHNQSTPSPEEVTFLLNGSRTFEGWLDDIALKNGLFWEYTYANNRPYISITGVVEADLQFEGLLTSTGSNDGNSSVESSWEDLQEFVEQNMSEYGSKHFSKSTGRIYVADRPEIVERVRRRVHYENEVYGKQIHYRIQLLTVNLDESESYRGGMSALYDDLKQTFSIDSGVSLGSGVNMSYGNTNTTSALEGTTGQLSLSNSLSKRTNAKEYTFIARNRSAISQIFKDSESYVKTITSSTTDNGTVVTPEVAELEEGVEIEFLATIQSGSRIALNLAFNQAYVSGRTQQSYSGNSITLPTQNDTVVLNQFTIPTGKSFILSDSSIDRATSDSGPARKLGIFEWLFGASTESSKSNSVRFLIITPTIMDQGA